MKKLNLLYLFLAMAFAGIAESEPTTNQVMITKIRPYNTPSMGVIYISVDQVSLCNSNTYVVDLAWSGSKEIYSAALAAMIAGKKVNIEIDNAGCANPGWTTKIQSLIVSP